MRERKYHNRRALAVIPLAAGGIGLLAEAWHAFHEPCQTLLLPSLGPRFLVIRCDHPPFLSMTDIFILSVAGLAVLLAVWGSSRLLPPVMPRHVAPEAGLIRKLSSTLGHSGYVLGLPVGAAVFVASLPMPAVAALWPSPPVLPALLLTAGLLATWSIVPVAGGYLTQLLLEMGTGRRMVYLWTGAGTYLGLALGFTSSNPLANPVLGAWILGPTFAYGFFVLGLLASREGRISGKHLPAFAGIASGMLLVPAWIFPWLAVPLVGLFLICTGWSVLRAFAGGVLLPETPS
jgi:hypothetical protein